MILFHVDQVPLIRKLCRNPRITGIFTSTIESSDKSHRGDGGELFPGNRELSESSCIFVEFNWERKICGKARSVFTDEFVQSHAD